MSHSNPDIYLTKSEQEAVRKSLEQIGSISEVLSKTVEYLEEGKSEWTKALLKAAPWLSVAFPYVGIVAGAVGIASKLFNKWAEPSAPNDLGAIACTIAWSESARVAIEKHVTNVFTWRTVKEAAKRTTNTIQALPLPEEANLSIFTFDIALIHPFVTRADEMLRVILRGGGVPEVEEIKIFNTLHERFKFELHELLTNPNTESKFKPFAEMISRGVTESHRSLLALSIHAEFQRRLFESEQTFQREPFSLSDIYIEKECGRLKWGEISSKYGDDIQSGFDEYAYQRIDPFSEKNGGRENMVDVAMSLITDVSHNEPIIVQGFAGHGKSAFTLKLCSELLKSQWGFIPIRIRMRNLRLEGSLLESIARAMEFCYENEADGYGFLKGFQITRAMFDTPHGKFRNLSRYVLILDGWDELEISSSEGFRTRVHRVLEVVRREFLDIGLGCRVRIVITGRPNPEVESSALLRESTPILTIRNLRKEQLIGFVDKLKALVEERSDQPDHINDGIWTWNISALEACKDIIESYESDDGKLPDELGIPLLAYLMIRIMTEIASQHDDKDKQRDTLIELMERPAHLYRRVMDLTVEKSGKAGLSSSDRDSYLKMARDLGTSLRRKLRYTAAAITAVGKEHISRSEWEKRMPKDLIASIGNQNKSTENDPFVRLMISFFFKGGHQEQGIEFVHKSFREYLFAEHIVEKIKEFADRLRTDMPQRESSLHDFHKGDARLELAKTLGEMFASHWMSREVSDHLDELFRWEIVEKNCDTEHTLVMTGLGLETEKISLQKWEAIRDALSDLWRWWSDGIHMRPYVEIDEDRGEQQIKPPYAENWIIKICSSSERGGRMETVTNVDSRLGEALFRLCNFVHYYVALALKDKDARMFCPLDDKDDSEEGDKSFLHQIARINSASDRPYWLFPARNIMRGINLKGAYLAGVAMYGVSLEDADLSETNLYGAWLAKANLKGANFRDAVLGGTGMSGANLECADLSGAELTYAWLAKANLNGANLSGAYLVMANVSVEQLRDVIVDVMTEFPKGAKYEQLKLKLLECQELEEDPDTES